MKLQTAVLDDTRLYWRNEQGSLTWVPALLPMWAGNLCEFGLKHDLHTIWVLPGSEMSRELVRNPNCLIECLEGYDIRTRENDKGITTFGSVKRFIGSWDEKRLVYFGFPEHDPKWMIDSEEWALADIENPIELLDIILSTEAALSPRRTLRGRVESEPFHLAYSPGYSGMALIKGVLKLHGHMQWLAPADLSMLPNVSEPGGFLWKRELDSGERTAKYIHFLDRNAQFPAAATGAELGEGTPDYYPPGLMHRPNLKLPGVWHIAVTGEYNPLLPLLAFGSEDMGAVKIHKSFTAKQWAYTPTIQAMELLGYQIEFIEGYQWPTHHRTLQEWAKHCWEARLELRAKYGKNSPQEHLTKMIANRGLGWLDLGVVRQEKRENEPTHRPDWYNMVRSLARYRMVLKLLELAKQGIYAVMIVADNIGIVSDEPNPELAAPGLMRRSAELGGFKYDGTYLLEQVLPFLDSLDPNAVRREVKKLEKVSFTIENINTSVGDKDIDTWLERQGE